MRRWLSLRERRGVVTYYVLFLLDLKARRVHIAEATPCPGESFMALVARNLTDKMDGLLLTKRVLVCDRDAKFIDRFKKTLEASGAMVVVTPCQAPNGSAHAERFVRSINEECLHRMSLLGERNLLRRLRDSTAHHHAVGNHQGIGNELVDAGELPELGPVECRERLGALLQHYRRAPDAHVETEAMGDV